MCVHVRSFLYENDGQFVILMSFCRVATISCVSILVHCGSTIIHTDDELLCVLQWICHVLGPKSKHENRSLK